MDRAEHDDRLRFRRCGQRAEHGCCDMAAAHPAGMWDDSPEEPARKSIRSDRPRNTRVQRAAALHGAIGIETACDNRLAYMHGRAPQHREQESADRRRYHTME
jgi:hypothetical protein